MIDDTFLARHCATLMRHQDSWVLCYLIQGRDTLIEITIALVGESREDSLRLAEILLRGHKLSRIAVL